MPLLFSSSSSLLWLSLFVLLFLTSTTICCCNAQQQDENKEKDAATTVEYNITTKHLTLHDGHAIPQVGLGVALTGEQTYTAVSYALQVGYRLFDTAAEESYGNEDQVGTAIHEYLVQEMKLAMEHRQKNNMATTANADTDSDIPPPPPPIIPRDTLFITTKLWDSEHGFYETLDAFLESYHTLNVGTIDLYLIHSPFGGHLLETWDALIYLQSKGYIKSIGVSNFGIRHLQLLKDQGRPLPTVNQFELHPLLYQQRLPLINWCQQHNIKVQAFGSLMFGHTEFTNSKLLTDMATKYQKSTTQVLLRWAIQHDILIIPKSSKPERILENSLIFDFTLSEEDMYVLDHWGDTLSEAQRLLYKKDWNWNPIDEAPVHAGLRHYWPSYHNVIFKDEHLDHEIHDNEKEYFEDESEHEYYYDDEYDDDDEDVENDEL